MKKNYLLFVFLLTGSVLFAQNKSEALKAELKKYEDGQALISQYLNRFDTLDFTVFSGQEWTRLHESHSKDIIVYWPDGHFTTGIEKHIEDLKYMFVYAPDTQIKEHPVKFGAGEWTSVIVLCVVPLQNRCQLEMENISSLQAKSFQLLCVQWAIGPMV